MRAVSLEHPKYRRWKSGGERWRKRFKRERLEEDSWANNSLIGLEVLRAIGRGRWLLQLCSDATQD